MLEAEVIDVSGDDAAVGKPTQVHVEVRGASHEYEFVTAVQGDGAADAAEEWVTAAARAGSFEALGTGWFGNADGAPHLRLAGP
jgi:hypothetical protein